MYSKEEASKLRQQFWISFGKYMKPVPAAEGVPINWINYKTGVKHVHFKMNADQHQVTIAIELTHPETDHRNLYYEKFMALKLLFIEALNENWIWEPNAANEYGMPLAKISITITGVSIFNQQTWPTIISFLKPRIIKLDHFWMDVKPLFEALG